MADIEYRPGQRVPEGDYIVILRPVPKETPTTEPTEAEPIMPPAVPPPETPMPPAQVPDENDEDENSNGSNMRGPTNIKNNPNNSMFPPVGGRRKGKMTKKAKKAKGTRKLSPYMKFAQEARKNILAENPSLKSDIIAVGKRIGEKWRALSAAEKARY